MVSVYQRDGAFVGDVPVLLDHSIRQICVWQNRLALLTCHEATSAGERQVVLFVLNDIDSAIAQLRELPGEPLLWKTASMSSKVSEMGFGLDMDKNRIVVSMEDLKIWTYHEGGLLERQPPSPTTSDAPQLEQQQPSSPPPAQPPQQGTTAPTAEATPTGLFKTLVRERPTPKFFGAPRKTKMLTGSMVEARLWGDRVFTVENRGIVEAWNFGPPQQAPVGEKQF